MEQNGAKYEAILARSFSRQERKTMGCCATLPIFIVIFTFCIFFKPYIIITDDNNNNNNNNNNNAASSPLSNVQVPKVDSLNLQATVHDGINIASQPYAKINEVVKPICDLKRPRSDICEANGDIRVIIGNSSTIFVVSNNDHSNMSWNIRPYARKGDESAMGSVTNLAIKKMHHSDQQIPRCTTKYNIPAVVFSTGGYAGNLFHDFTDLLIPLYLTSPEFDGEVRFLVTNKRPRWMNKFKEVLRKLSRYEIIDLDRENYVVLCFPRIIVGLNANKEFSIDASGSSSYSMKNFTAFLRSAYDLKRDTSVNLSELKDSNKKVQRRLLIISRNKTRRLLNVGEVCATAKTLGFDVAVQETDSNMTKVSKFVNGFDVMVGVHGAGLSNMVFLPEKAVVVQVLGLGMDWIGKNDFEVPSLDMGLRYIGYNIGVNESSLVEEYPLGHQVLRNYSAIRVKEWKAFREVYLDRQDVKVDVKRFRGTLLKALELLQHA